MQVRGDFEPGEQVGGGGARALPYVGVPALNTHAVIGGDVIGEKGDAVGAAPVDRAIAVEVQGCDRPLALGIVSVEGGDAVGVGHPRKLALLVVLQGGGRIIGGGGINHLVRSAQHVEVSLGPFVGAAGGVRADAQGIEALDTTLALRG